MWHFTLPDTVISLQAEDETVLMTSLPLLFIQAEKAPHYVIQTLKATCRVGPWMFCVCLPTTASLHDGCHGDRTPTRVPGQQEQQESTTGGRNGRQADVHVENEMRVFWLSYLPVLAADVL